MGRKMGNTVSEFWAVLPFPGIFQAFFTGWTVRRWPLIGTQKGEWGGLWQSCAVLGRGWIPGGGRANVAASQVSLIYA